MRPLAALGLVASLTAAAGARADAPRCDVEDVLSGAAAALALDGTGPTAAAILRAARGEGSDLPSLSLFVDDGRDARRAARWVERLRARAQAPIACGHATSGTATIWLAGARGGSLDPVENDATTFHVRLAAGFSRPRVVAFGADGALVDLPVDDGQVEVGPDVVLPARVQLVATGPRGPRPVAERVLGVLPDDSAPHARSSAETLVALRDESGVPPLRPNRLLAAEAAAHAQRVCDAGAAVHVLGGGDPETRLALRGVRARVVGETVARAADEPSAMAALLASPSHRHALVDRRFTDAGLGRARSTDGHTCLVVLLAAWPRIVPR